MENNINNNNLTAKEIFDQIVMLQNQLTENHHTSLFRLGDAFCIIRGDDEENRKDISSQIEPICSVFAMREETMRIMLEFYRKMYEDYRGDKFRKEERVGHIFDCIVKDFTSSDSGDISQLDKLPEIAEKISQVVDRIYKE